MISPQSPTASTSSGGHGPSPSGAFISPEAQLPAAPLPDPTLVTYTPSGSSTKRSVKARIDRNVPLDEIIRQLCTSAQLGVQEPPALFALRDVASEELVTFENLGQKLEAGACFKLVASPMIEAVEICDKLGQREDEAAVKKATFQLKSFVRVRGLVRLSWMRRLNCVCDRSGTLSTSSSLGADCTNS
jgi:engulfment/cell motility protein 1